MKKPAFCICKTKRRISFAVTAKLISAFVFTTRLVQPLYFLNPKFQASSNLLWLYSRPVWDLVENPKDWFSCFAAHSFHEELTKIISIEQCHERICIPGFQHKPSCTATEDG